MLCERCFTTERAIALSAHAAEVSGDDHSMRARSTQSRRRLHYLRLALRELQAGQWDGLPTPPQPLQPAGLDALRAVPYD
jgi:hypothetical protein